MTDPWSEAIEEAYASAPLEDDILSTIELRHPALEQPIRVVADLGDILAYDEEGQPIFGHMLTLDDDAPENPGESVRFVSCGFEFSLPEQQEGQLPSVSIGIDNVAYLLSPQLDGLIGERASLALTYREYLASDTTKPQFILDGLSMSSIKSNLTKVSGTASFADLINRSFPNQVYRLVDFPGLAG